VRAKDTAGNTGPYSNVASATTGTVAPTISAPGTLSAGATSATQIGLSWGAATETGGTLSQYLIERCQGSGCSSFTQVGTTAVPATTFTDSGLTAGTSYSYRVRAQDTAGNTGPYSNTATSVTVTGTPSAPSGLAASAASSTQVNLSWSAATETGGSIAQYLIERCQGAGCSSFTQVGTATQLSFSDSALSGSTAYSYRVRAKDAAGNTGPYSNVATATTAAPTLTAPTALSASSVSSTQINLTWGAASETGGVISQYRVERCQGSGCSTFAQIGTATGTSYNDAGLTASTAYSYRVRAADAGGNTGPYSNLATATTASAGGGGGPITFVQTSNATPQTPQRTVTVRFNATQVAGDLNVVVVGWGDTTAAVGTVTDSVGNVYRLAVGPTAISGTATQAIYYAANIVGAAAGANSVTVSFTAAAIYPDIRLAEYSGIDPNNPLDVVASATGNSAASTTPPVTTTFANDLLIGANLVQSLTITGGSGFSTRVITSPDGDILEDRIVTATGSYSASANIAAAPWIMQLAAFRRHP
jgi:chitodextrinase